MEITVKDLIKRLQIENPDGVVHFEGFEFYRVKSRGHDSKGREIVQIELQEVNTELSEEDA